MRRAEGEAYRTLEENLRKLGFEPTDHNGKPSKWRWKVQLRAHETLIVEFLADDPTLKGGALQVLPTEGQVGAVNIPHAAMVFDLHEKREVEVGCTGRL